MPPTSGRALVVDSAALRRDLDDLRILAEAAKAALDKNLSSVRLKENLEQAVEDLEMAKRKFELSRRVVWAWPVGLSLTTRI